MTRKSIFQIKVGLTLTACATFLLTGCFESKEAKPKDDATVVVDKDPVNPQDNEKVVAVKKTETVDQARIQELIMGLLDDPVENYQHSLTLNNETQKIACDLHDEGLYLMDFYSMVNQEPIVHQTCLSKATNRRAFEALNQESSDDNSENNQVDIFKRKQIETQTFAFESGSKLTLLHQQTLEWSDDDFRLETADTIYQYKCSQSSAIEQNGLEACERPESL